MKAVEAELTALVEKMLNKEINDREDVMVVVEGEKDRKVLISLGVTSDKIIVYSSLNLDNIVKRLEAKKIKELVILTDFDKEGKKIEKRLIEICHMLGINPNASLKRKIFSEIFKNTGKSITSVENLIKITKHR